MLPKLGDVTTVPTALSGMAVHELFNIFCCCPLYTLHRHATASGSWMSIFSTDAHVDVPAQGPFVGLHSWLRAHAHSVCFLALLPPSSSL